MERWRFIPTNLVTAMPSKDSDEVSKMLRVQRTKTLRRTTLNPAKSTNLPADSLNGLRNPNNLNRLDPQFSFELLITKWQCVLGALHGTSVKKLQRRMAETLPTTLEV